MLVELILWIPDSLVLVRHVVCSSIHRRSLCFSERRFSPKGVFSFFVGLFFEKADFFSLVLLMAQKLLYIYFSFFSLFCIREKMKPSFFFLLVEICLLRLLNTRLTCLIAPAPSCILISSIGICSRSLFPMVSALHTRLFFLLAPSPNSFLLSVGPLCSMLV